MSRTIRRKSVTRPRWVLRAEWFSAAQLEPGSKEGRKRMAKYHSDHAHIMHSRGPKGFRAMSTHRPDRMAARADIALWISGGMDPDGDWNSRMSRTYRQSTFFTYWD